MTGMWYLRQMGPLRATVALGAMVGGGLLLWAGWMEVGTALLADQRQAQLLEEWEDEEVVPVAADQLAGSHEREVAVGEPVARLSFHAADGSRILTETDLVIVSGVGADQLASGVGHYPTTTLPGLAGNFAVAGHRTTHGAPFNQIDQLQAGQTILVTDDQGWAWAYRVTSHHIVSPDDTSVIGPDPLGANQGTITLTTCHPKGSAAQRLVVFGVLADYAPADQSQRLLAAGG